MPCARRRCDHRAIAASVPTAWAQSVEDLGKLSIEDLAHVEVTSVTKSPEPLSQAAASVYVITAEDIVRSGATTLPEVLRLTRPNPTTSYWC